MRTVSNIYGPVGYGETPGETGDSTASTTGKALYQELISKANSVPIIRVFRHYGLRLNNYNHRIVCPFKSHKGGHESTGSFQWYPLTNSYCCYGCRVGSHACDFVAEMDGITKKQAALKIMKLFGDLVDAEAVFAPENFSERLEIMLSFSNTIRDFRQLHSDENAHSFIENMCMVYDDLNLKHKKLDNAALRHIVENLIEVINSYKSCPTL